MTQKPSDDEASFEGLISFDTVPPPAGAAGDGVPDVHNASTTVAELPDSFLDSLKVGDAAPALAPVPGPVAPMPEVLAKPTVFVDFTDASAELESAFASALEGALPAEPAPPVDAVHYQQPYPSPAQAFAPTTTVTERPPPRREPSPSATLASIGWRGFLVALAALLLGFGLALLARTLLLQHHG